MTISLMGSEEFYFSVEKNFGFVGFLVTLCCAALVGLRCLESFSLPTWITN
jgi:hypothetical protein